jgi:hypothetical protein
MANESWKNPWKLTAVGMALVIATVLVTGLVVANWKGQDSDKKVVDVTPGRAAPRSAAPTAADTPTAPTAAGTPAAPTAAGIPTQSAINTCNESAEAQAGQREKTKDTVIAGAIGAVAGAAVGAAGGAVVGGGSGAGKGAVIGGLVGAGGGTLYGLNENRKHDESYRNAYAACMRSRGYTG